MTVTGTQIEQWCRDNRVHNFRGVYCSDQLPDIYRPENDCFVINHSSCKTSGSHWLGCRVQGDHVDWFDSYGLPPNNKLEDELMNLNPSLKQPDFIDWLIKIGVKTYKYNPFDIQSVRSTVCGLYACYFCKYGLPSLQNAAWSWLSEDVNKNDKIIKKLVII
jgi:hypothetical protein